MCHRANEELTFDYTGGTQADSDLDEYVARAKLDGHGMRSTYDKMRFPFSLRDILVRDGSGPEDASGTPIPGLVCHCGAPNCRGFVRMNNE